MNKSDKATVILICTKAMVSPLKVVSLRCLELCAALLGARLSEKVWWVLNVLRRIRNISFPMLP